MHPCARRSVRIVGDEGQTFGMGRRAEPFERRRNVLALTGVDLRYRLAFDEGRVGKRAKIQVRIKGRQVIGESLTLGRVS